MKMKKRGIRSYWWDRRGQIGMDLEGNIQVIERPMSYRDALASVVTASPSDRMNVYMEFIKEVGDGASEDTKRKIRKRLGL